MLKYQTFGKNASFYNFAASSYLKAKNFKVFSEIVNIPARPINIHDEMDSSGMNE